MDVESYSYEIRPIPYDPWDITKPIAFATTKEEAEKLLETHEFMRNEKLMITTRKIK